MNNAHFTFSRCLLHHVDIIIRMKRKHLIGVILIISIDLSLRSIDLIVALALSQSYNDLPYFYIVEKVILPDYNETIVDVLEGLIYLLVVLADIIYLFAALLRHVYPRFNVKCLIFLSLIIYTVYLVSIGVTMGSSIHSYYQLGSKASPPILNIFIYMWSYLSTVIVYTIMYLFLLSYFATKIIQKYSIIGIQPMQANPNADDGGKNYRPSLRKEAFSANSSIISEH